MVTPLHSRAEVGLRAPRARPSNITPRHLTGHYGGPAPARWPWSHARCPTIWKSWQDYHMRPGGLGVKDGAADIGYTSGVCPHGHRYEGRGPGVRSGGNGTNAGNQNSYACVYIAGEGTPLTDDAKRAFLDEARRLKVPLNRSHSDWKPTECPGSPLRAWIRAGVPAPGTTTTTTTDRGDLDMDGSDREKLNYVANFVGLLEKGAPQYGVPPVLATLGKIDRDIAEAEGKPGDNRSHRGWTMTQTIARDLGYKIEAGRITGKPAWLPALRFWLDSLPAPEEKSS